MVDAIQEEETTLSGKGTATIETVGWSEGLKPNAPYRFESCRPQEPRRFKMMSPFQPGHPIANLLNMQKKQEEDHRRRMKNINEESEKRRITDEARARKTKED